MAMKDFDINALSIRLIPLPDIYHHEEQKQMFIRRLVHGGS